MNLCQLSYAKTYHKSNDCLKGLKMYKKSFCHFTFFFCLLFPSFFSLVFILSFISFVLSGVPTRFAQHLLPRPPSATSQVPTLFHLGSHPTRPLQVRRAIQTPCLTPLLMVLQLLSLLCLNDAPQKVQYHNLFMFLFVFV